MKTTRIRISFLLSFIVIAFTISPILSVVGEEYTLFDESFHIAPSRPAIIAEQSFELSPENEYVLGIPESQAIGRRSLADNSHYFEMWSDTRVEVYFLDSFGFGAGEYGNFADNWDGSPPTEYTYSLVCDGYLKFEFQENDLGRDFLPKLVLYTPGENATGNFFWTEGLQRIQNDPYYARAIGSDRVTVDNVRIFNVNASIDAYLLTDEQYEAYLNESLLELSLTETILVAPPSDYLLNGSGIEITLDFTAPKHSDLHLILWNDNLREGVIGSIIWNYSYQRGFFENYWSLMLVLLFVIGFVLVAVYQEKALPPIVWTMRSIKYYLLTVPWQAIKDSFADLRDNFGEVWAGIRGIISDEELTPENISNRSYTTVLIGAIVGFLGIHRYLSGKISTGIVYTLTFGLVGVGWLVDLAAVIMDVFRDSDGKLIVKPKKIKALEEGEATK